MNVVVAEKFNNFEWLAQGITAKSPIFEQKEHSTEEKPIDYQDRLGAIAAMGSQFEKSITSIIVFGDKSEMDFEYVRSHLALIMATNAKLDNRREPQKINIKDLSLLIARMVIDFALDPALENNFTPQGRLYYAGIRSWQMDVEAYRKTWKQYENMMVIALEMAIKDAGEAVENYRKNTYKEMKA